MDKKELGVTAILTVHHSKYALACHPWDKPLKNARQVAEQDSIRVWMPGMEAWVLYHGTKPTSLCINFSFS